MVLPDRGLQSANSNCPVYQVKVLVCSVESQHKARGHLRARPPDEFQKTDSKGLREHLLPILAELPGDRRLSLSALRQLRDEQVQSAENSG